MWSWIQKRRAIRRYRRRLGSALRRRYGREQHYTPEQVESTVVTKGLGIDFLCFALAMYCSRESFNAYHAARGEVCDYDAMRSDAGVGACDGAPVDAWRDADEPDRLVETGGADFDAGDAFD